jgi:circadian clock protein KaiB
MIATPEPVDSMADPTQEVWHLRLYVAGASTRSLRAFANLRRLCEEYIPDRYELEIVDLEKRPSLARDDDIVAIPTLIRSLPRPMRRIIGDLSDTERVLLSLQVTGSSS